MTQSLYEQLGGQKLPLFPTYASTAEALEHAIALLPDTHRNDVCSAIYGYHNSLLAQLQRQLDPGERQS